jgi:SAM-dependent methyltransferase
MAVDLCRGRVLDAGAGAGCHSLHLQQRSLDVCAIDISPEAVEVMKKRGIREVHRADVFKFQAQPFDTILMMMNGIGVVETLQGLDRFLRSVPRLLSEKGQILLDSHDARHEIDPDELVHWESHQTQPYFGEVTLRLEYKGQIGPSFGWLYLDSDTLTRYAEKTGWFCKIVHREEDGAYLAQLTRPG